METAVMYMNHYVVVILFIGLALLFTFIIWTLAKTLRPDVSSDVKETTYESGNITSDHRQVQFQASYYALAMMFVLFGVQMVFLYLWAVAYGQLGLFALVEMFIFVLLLLIGFVYAWRKKVLTWRDLGE